MITPRFDQPRRSVHDDDEYRENYTSAEYVNALFALNNGWIGRGVRVGVLDNGVKIVPELEGQVDVAASRDFRPDRQGGPNIGDDSSNHGTPISTVIAARNDGQGIQGLAPGVTIVSLRTDRPENSSLFSSLINAEAILYAADIGIKLINMSQSRPRGEATTVVPFVDAVRYLNQKTQGLIISSAGNDFNGQVANNWIDTTPDTAKNWLHVVAIEADGRGFNLAPFSNQCGAAMSRCLAAPDRYEVQLVDGRITRVDGTSVSAPIVTSIAAMILSKWPQLTGVQAGDILLRTARDIGAPGVDEVFGHGLVDAEAALRPINPMLSNGSTTSSVNTVMVMGNAFGSGGSTTSTTNSLDAILSSVTVLDEYGRDYSGSLSQAVIRPAVDRLWMHRRVEAQVNMGRAGFAAPNASAVIGFTAFDTGLRNGDGTQVLRNQLTNAQVAYRLNADLSVTAGFNSDNNVMADIFGLAPTSDAMFAYVPRAQTSFGMAHKLGKGNVAINAHAGRRGDTSARGLTVRWGQGNTSVKVGFADERGTVFGTPTGIGSLRFGDGASTFFLEGATGIDAGPWSFDGYASVGSTHLRLAKDMLMTDADAIITGRYGLIASRPVLDGRLSLGLAQELVALSGQATFTIANGFDHSVGALLFQDRRVDLRGSIRPQFIIGYERWGERSGFNLGAASDADARDVRAVASWQMRF